MTAAYFMIVILAFYEAGKSKLLRVSLWSGSSCLGSAVTKRPRKGDLVEFATFFALMGCPGRRVMPHQNHPMRV